MSGANTLAEELWRALHARNLCRDDVIGSEESSSSATGRHRPVHERHGRRRITASTAATQAARCRPALRVSASEQKAEPPHECRARALGHDFSVAHDETVEVPGQNALDAGAESLRVVAEQAPSATRREPVARATEPQHESGADASVVLDVENQIADDEGAA